MDFSIIINEWTVYWQGLYTTLFLVAISLLLGLLIAVPLGILRNSDTTSGEMAVTSE